MNVARFRPAALVAAILLSTAPAGLQSPDQELRGYPQAEAARQREWEQKFRSVPDPERLREYMRIITAEPHHAGGPGSKAVAEYVLARFQEWGLEARIEEFEALMPMPTERLVQLVEPESFTAALEEPAIPEDPDSGDAGQVPTYNAYSADGDVTAPLVYVNYGTPEDYEELEKLGVDVKGAIVIARYGRSWRGIKPKVAAEHGAVGCIIYSDPRDDGYFEGDVFPEGPWRPWQGVQRGSVMDMPIYPGDPLTPGWGAVPGSRKLARSDVRTLVSIPVLPISYGDAEPLLRHLGGPVAPEPWRGALPITYHVGPGPSKVRVKLAFDWQVRPLYNVVATIPGAVYPEEWVLHGNHHDAWVNGADDPTSGNVALMETARGLAELLKQGWRPARTIIIASWDAEEWGLIGSTEWAEHHAADLREKGVVYINSDSSGTGWLSAGGSHSLQAFVTEVARDIPGPRTDGTVFEEARARAIDQAETEERKQEVRQRDHLRIGPLGSGSDYTVFLDHLTMASMNLGFGGERGDGIYHSIYDSFTWYTRFSDKDFTHTRALSQTIGTALMRLAGATVLPFEFGHYSRTMGEYVDEIEKLHEDAAGAPGLDLGPLRSALERLDRAAAAHAGAMARLRDADSGARLDGRPELEELNRLLYTTERALGHDAGLPQREWYKHLVYAPGFYTGYGVKTFPGIREGIEQQRWQEAQQFVPIVAGAVERVAGQVERAAELLGRLLE